MVSTEPAAGHSKISNSNQGRIEKPDFHTDWSLDWGAPDESFQFRWSFVDHGQNLPYVIVSVCSVQCNAAAAKAYALAIKEEKRHAFIT
jgi:hypothetical protein